MSQHSTNRPAPGLPACVRLNPRASPPAFWSSKLTGAIFPFVSRKTPSQKRFISTGVDATEIRSKLADRREVKCVEPQPGAEDLVAVEVEGDDPPRETWSKLQRSLGPEVLLAPVLLDEDGAETYPTGILQVRFAEEPDDDELARFRSSYGLRSVGRNKFSKSLVNFTPENPGEAYLPDLTAEIESDPKVQSAWCDTKSKFRRT